MADVIDFGTVVLVVAGGFTLALAANKLTERFAVPAPALFLLAAAIASDVHPPLADVVSIREIERIGTVALIMILFLPLIDEGRAWSQREVTIVDGADEISRVNG